MNTLPPAPDRRRHRRQPVRGRVRVLCYKGVLDIGPNLAVSPLEVSELGIRLVLKVALDPGQEVCLGIEGHGQLKPMKRGGRVAWCTPAQGGTFHAGIELSARLNHVELYKLT